MDESWLDVSVTKCPYCSTHFVEASWFVVFLESDLECGNCGRSFNAKKYSTDRVLLQFKLDWEGRVETVQVREHLED